MEKRRVWQIIIGAVIVILIAALIWFNFFYYRNCENKTCFNDYLRDCKKAKFNSFGNMSFEYTVLGKSAESCNVNVNWLKGDLNNQDSLKLESKSMVCSIPLGAVIQPESDISLCHGILKEGLQDLIIQKLHNYLVQNLGKINSEIQ